MLLSLLSIIANPLPGLQIVPCSNRSFPMHPCVPRDSTQQFSVTFRRQPVCWLHVPCCHPRVYYHLLQRRPLPFRETVFSSRPARRLLRKGRLPLCNVCQRIHPEMGSAWRLRRARNCHRPLSHPSHRLMVLIQVLSGHHRRHPLQKRTTLLAVVRLADLKSTC